MGKCKHCGTMNTSDAKYCRSCGKLLEQKKETNVWYYRLVVTFLCLLVVSGILYAILGNPNSSSIVAPESIVEEETADLEESIDESLLPAPVQELLDEMVYVEGGSFIMGYDLDFENDNDEYTKELINRSSPRHEVYLSSYYISKYEVTQELWLAVMDKNPSHNNGSPYFPVDSVCWYDCQSFITKLNELTGRSFRLPTEAEWEYAARGGNKSKNFKFAGSDDIDDIVYFGRLYSLDDKSKHAPLTVGSKGISNELGLYDMSGNVYEWVNDRWGRYSVTTQSNPKGNETGEERVLRGGSSYTTEVACYVWFRAKEAPYSHRKGYGFRLAMNIEETPAEEAVPAEQPAY